MNIIKVKCEKCNKEIEALTERQAKYLLKQHELSKHNGWTRKITLEKVI